MLQPSGPEKDRSEGRKEEASLIPARQPESRPLQDLAKVVCGGNQLEEAAVRDEIVNAFAAAAAKSLQPPVRVLVDKHPQEKQRQTWDIIADDSNA